jgi:hypothetical protein
MTMARARQWALGICAVAGIAAAITSAALISAVVSRPEQLATAMDRDAVQALLGVIADRVVAAVREISRYL